MQTTQELPSASAVGWVSMAAGGTAENTHSIDGNAVPEKCSGHQIPPWTLNSRICVKCTSFGEQPCHSCLTLASPKQFKIIPRRLTSESKETILKQVSRNVDWKKPCQLCCLWEETHDIDPKIGLAWQEAELTLNKCSGNVMKRAIRMLLFVCLETQQLPNTPNQRWMTALPCQSAQRAALFALAQSDWFTT